MLNLQAAGRGMAKTTASVTIILSALLVHPVIAVAAPVFLEPDDMLVESTLPRPTFFPYQPSDLSPFLPKTARIFVIKTGWPFPPAAFGLTETGGHYAIFGVELQRQGPPKTCRAAIDDTRARRIVSAWDQVVLDARFQPGPPWIGADGALEHFVSRLKYRTIAGRMWTPPSGSKPGWLSRIGSDLMQICSQDRVQSVDAASKEIDGALEHLN